MIRPVTATLGTELLDDGRVRILRRAAVGGPWVCLQVVEPDDLQAALAEAPTMPEPGAPAPAGGPGLRGDGLGADVLGWIRQHREG